MGIHVLSLDGIFKSGVWLSQAKSQKRAKVRYMVPKFGVCKGFVVVLWWGCNLIRRARLGIFDLKC